MRFPQGEFPVGDCRQVVGKEGEKVTGVIKSYDKQPQTIGKRKLEKETLSSRKCV